MYRNLPPWPISEAHNRLQVATVHFSQIPIDQVDWDALDCFPDRVAFQTRGWVSFLAESQNAKPIVAALHDSGRIVGYFTGLLFSKLGVPMLGSPFPGWTTPFMGFNLLPGVPRRQALEALESFALRQLRCFHLEVSDIGLSPEDGAQSGFAHDFGETLITDLTQTEKEVLRTLDHSCRRNINKAEQNGVWVEEANDEAFASDYYEQLKGVFQRQGLVPTYNVDRMRQLIRNVHPSGCLLLLRARDRENTCIATSVYVGFNKIAFYWGNASIRAKIHLCPNQLMNWYALKYWKRRGMEIFDWGGAGDYGQYKTRYGGRPFSYPKFRKSRFAFGALRSGALKAFQLRQQLLGRLRASQANTSAAAR
jgi:Acetyltransferase (GNAT) domain